MIIIIIFIIIVGLLKIWKKLFFIFVFKTMCLSSQFLVKKCELFQIYLAFK